MNKNVTHDHVNAAYCIYQVDYSLTLNDDSHKKITCDHTNAAYVDNSLTFDDDSHEIPDNSLTFNDDLHKIPTCDYTNAACERSRLRKYLVPRDGHEHASGRSQITAAHHHFLVCISQLHQGCILYKQQAKTITKRVKTLTMPRGSPPLSCLHHAASSGLHFVKTTSKNH